MRKNLFLFFLFFSFLVQAQNCEKVWLKGRALDTLNSMPFMNFMIVNHSTGQAVFGKPNGFFGVYVNNKDSIVISARGYLKFGFRVNADSNCVLDQLVYIESKSTELSGVLIKPLKSVQEIKEERESLAMRETRTVTGINVIQSPITALYEHFSKEGKSKEKVAQMEYEDKISGLLQDLLKTYVTYEIVDLNPNEFESFIRFLNIEEVFLKTASDLELVAYIKEKFEQYKIYKEE